MSNTTNKTNSNEKFNVTFGTRGTDAIPANAAVLLIDAKERQLDGTYKPVQKFMAVNGVRSTKPTDIILPLLAVMLADARKRAGFNSAYKIVIVSGKETKSGIIAKSTFTRYLNGTEIFKSDSNGELTRSLTLDDGLKLRGTALAVKEKQAIFNATGNDLRVCMYKTAQAIAEQATMRKDILKAAKAIYEEATTVETKAAAKTEKAA